MGERVNVCVPTGNFGNILAAFYARCMGLPIKKLLCASNANNVLTTLLRPACTTKTGRSSIRRRPSMDILVSSNLERLLYLLSGSDEDGARLYAAAWRRQAIMRWLRRRERGAKEIVCGRLR